LKSIEVGDSKSEVIDKIGKPYYKMEYYTKQHLVYYMYDDLMSLFFTEDKFPYIGFYPLLRTGTEYWVIVEGDKVVSHGRKDAYIGSGSITKTLNSKNIILEIEK
jgi:hypothetical protein